MLNRMLFKISKYLKLFRKIKQGRNNNPKQHDKEPSDQTLLLEVVYHWLFRGLPNIELNVGRPFKSRNFELRFLMRLKKFVHLAASGYCSNFDNSNTTLPQLGLDKDE